MNVLLTSVGRRGYLVKYFRQALAKNGKVIAANCAPNTSGMTEADVACVVPPASSPDFIDALLTVCRSHDVELLFSLHDWEAPFIAAQAKRFTNAGVTLGVSSPRVIEIGLDKFATWEFCLQNRINCPATLVDEDEIWRALKEQRIAFPLIVKPRRGQGSEGLYVVHNQAELSAALVLLRAQVPRFQDNNLSARDNGMCVVVQEYLKGDEYGLDVVNDLKGRFRTCLVKRKFAMRAGETDAAETVKDPALEQFGAAIGTALGHVGMLDVDVMVRDGLPFLLEFNPRFGGHYPFSHVAGANVPAALVAWASGREADPKWLQVRPGVRTIKELSLKVLKRTNEKNASPKPMRRRIEAYNLIG
jgi:carbamoyl-phosphate synthase large subunit